MEAEIMIMNIISVFTVAATAIVVGKIIFDKINDIIYDRKGMTYGKKE